MATGYAKAIRSTGKRYLKDEDFQEDDVWGLMENLGGSSVPKQRNPKAFSSSSSSSSSSSRHFPSTPRMIPRKDINPSKEHHRRSSAPVNIPKNRQMMYFGNGYGDHYGGHGVNMTGYPNGGCRDGARYHDAALYGDHDADGHKNEDDGDGDGDDDIVPPHEYIARRLARTQISSFSVCEGIGRKLKGRDLSEVRNDVLRKTGFLER